MSAVAEFLSFIVSRIGAAEVTKILTAARESKHLICPNCKTTVTKDVSPCPKCTTPLRWF